MEGLVIRFLIINCIALPYPQTTTTTTKEMTMLTKFFIRKILTAANV